MFFYEFCDISKNIFVTEHLRTTACALAFPSNFTKMGTANCVLKTSDEYSLSRKVNLRSIVQVYHFFLGSINFQCMFSLLPEAAAGVEVFVRKRVLKN